MCEKVFASSIPCALVDDFLGALGDGAGRHHDHRSAQLHDLPDRGLQRGRGRPRIGAGGELDAQRIGELCMTDLRDVDPGAYMQFAGTLPSVNPEIAAGRRTGSVRSARKDAELPRKAASRRGNDE